MNQRPTLRRIVLGTALTAAMVAAGAVFAAGWAAGEVGVAKAKGRNTEGTKMTQADHEVEIKLAGRRMGRPPLSRLMIDVTLHNRSGQARWYILPKDVHPGEAATGGVNVLEAYALSGTGRAVVARFLGTGGFQAVLLPAGAQVRLRHLPLSLWGEAPATGLLLSVLVASDITVGGQPLHTWFAGDLRSDERADVSEEQAQIVGTHKTADGKEVPVALTDPHPIDVRLDLSQPAQ